MSEWVPPRIFFTVKVQERAVASHWRQGRGRGALSRDLRADGGHEMVIRVRVMAARASGGRDAEYDYSEEHFGQSSVMVSSRYGVL